MTKQDELTIARTELAFNKGENKKLVAELILARKELAFQKMKRENGLQNLALQI